MNDTRNALTVVLSAILTLVVSTASGQPVLEWVEQYGTIGLDKAFDVAVGSAGDVYVAGRTDPDYSGFASIAFVRKYDPTGALHWMQELGADTDEGESFSGVSVDESGNVYVAGYTNGDLVGTSAGGRDSLLSKYDSGGALQWMRQWGTSELDSAHGVSVDDFGNVYVSGITLGSLDGANHGDTDAFLTKYDATGALQWTRQWGGSLMDESSEVATDGLGNVYVAGFVDDVRNGFRRDGDAFLAKYDASGAQLWMRTLSEGQGSAARGVSVDGLGNVYITGTSDWDSDFGDIDPFVAKYDTDGALHWRQSERTSETDNCYDISADGLGNVYITGHSSVHGGAEPDAFLMKYDDSGGFQWDQLLGTSSFDRARGVWADGLGNVYVAGSTEGSLGGPNAGGNPAFDAFLAKFSDTPLLPADFNGDGRADIHDLNSLLANGPLANDVTVVPGQTELFDLSGDGVINMDDVSHWLSDAAAANGLASPYKYGDANLDGTVDVTDFNLWNSRKFNYSLAWDDGDFDGNGAVDESDFLVWNNHKFTSSGDVATVPETSAGLLVVLATGWLAFCHTRRGKLDVSNRLLGGTRFPAARNRVR